jgi:two-component system sensor histidine kinase UhpB
MKTENRALMKELILVQDNERKDIARDLHDEAGPCLFSIRAGAVKLNELISGSTPDLSLIQEICANVNRASEALQTLFHGLLGRLRPRGLHEFGLSAALKSLTMSWSVAHPEVELELNCPHDLSSLDEVVSLTAYRVVQEAVTNIFRHAKANRAQIKVEFGSMSAAAYDEPDAECQPTLQITIEDNGVGIAEQGNFGFGLIGMSERVEALGGRIAIENRSAGGTRVAVSLPLSGSVEEAG